MHLVVFKLSFITVSIRPCKNTKTFHSIFILTFKMTLIKPPFFTLTMLKVVLELTFIHASMGIDIHSISVCHIIFYSTFIHVTIFMNEFTLSYPFTQLPITFIISSILPQLYSKAVPQIFITIINHLASINTVVWEDHFFFIEEVFLV